MATVPCPACRTTGKIKVLVKCNACGGDGEVVDPATGKVTPCLAGCTRGNQELLVICPICDGAGYLNTRK